MYGYKNANLDLEETKPEINNETFVEPDKVTSKENN